MEMQDRNDTHPLRVYWQLAAARGIINDLTRILVRRRDDPAWAAVYKALTLADIQIAGALDFLPDPPK